MDILKPLFYIFIINGKSDFYTENAFLFLNKHFFSNVHFYCRSELKDRDYIAYVITKPLSQPFIKILKEM